MTSRNQKAAPKLRRGRKNSAQVGATESYAARLARDIRAMSKEEVDKELRKRGRDPERVAAEVRDLATRRLADLRPGS